MSHYTESVGRKAFYEIRMFRYLCNAISSSEFITFEPGNTRALGTGGDDNQPSVWADLESLLLHTRVLYGFFFKKREKKDDVIAADFVATWESIKPEEPPYLKKRNARLNKGLAHLSSKRVEFETDKKAWDIAEIKESLEPAIEKFLAALPDEAKPWFKLPPPTENETRPIPRILVVDDDECTRQSVRELLNMALRVEADAAENGDEALKMMKKKPYSVALVDLRMPKMDGLALMGAMKKENIATAVIVVTGYGGVSEAVKALKMGAFDFLTKPPDPQHLCLLVHRALRERGHVD